MTQFCSAMVIQAAPFLARGPGACRRTVALRVDFLAVGITLARRSFIQFKSRNFLMLRRLTVIPLTHADACYSCKISLHFPIGFMHNAHLLGGLNNIFPAER